MCGSTRKAFKSSPRFTHLSGLPYIYVYLENNLFIFNGYDSISTNYFQDIIKINLDNLANNSLTFESIKSDGNRPSLRGNVASSLVGNKVYIFGGTNVDLVSGDLWTLNLDNNEWS